MIQRIKLVRWAEVRCVAGMTANDIGAALSHQAKASEMLGSPFTSALLHKAAENFLDHGIVHDILLDWPDEPVASALALRFAGALNWLRLSSRAPQLTPLYPPRWQGDDGALWRGAEATAKDHRDDIRAFIRKPIQTNEIGRSAPLLLGFLDVAAQTKRPLRLLEIGASGGLNLLWDRFHYVLGEARWGDEKSPVTLAPKWKGASPQTDIELSVASRNGCDINPVNYADESEVQRTLAFIWPDQVERVDRFLAAVALFHRDPVMIEKADAAEWLEKKLNTAPEAVTSVVYHSIVWQYLPEETKERVQIIVKSAATPEKPIAWIRLEPEDPKAIPEVRVTLWPSGETRRLAWAHPHGTSIDFQPVRIE